MKIPYVNCVRCHAKLEGPFDPPHSVPPEVCTHCGECPYVESLAEIADIVPPPGKEIGSVLTVDANTNEATLEHVAGTLDLVERVRALHAELKGRYTANDAALGTKSIIEGTLWGMQRGPDAARKMLS